MVNPVLFFLLYLQKYTRYRDIQYLVLKLLKSCLEYLLCNFFARVIFFEIGAQTYVPFFMHHPLPNNLDVNLLCSLLLSGYLKVIFSFKYNRAQFILIGLGFIPVSNS